MIPIRALHPSCLMLTLLALPLASAQAEFASPEAPAGSYAQKQAVALRGWLVFYRDIERQGGWPEFSMGEVIEPGASDARIPALRRILAAAGDGLESAGDSAQYDEALQEAVMLFQERHGLTPDGIIGKSTQRALAAPVGERIGQIEATLHRLERDMPDEARYILVNIPEFKLRGFDSGDKALEMRVIVGAPRNPTPVFENAITRVAFNPHWGVPKRIAARELLPKIQQDPEFIDKENFEVFTLEDGERVAVDASTIDWKTLSAGHFPYMLRQRPGGGNALGRVKFLLPDSNDIYLHDTSSPQLFAKDERALSHGCIRVEAPRELAKFALTDQEGWDGRRVEKTYEAAAARTVKAGPLPVRTVYWTAWVNETTGKPHFARDIYGHDQRLLARLKREQEKRNEVELAQNRP